MRLKNLAVVAIVAASICAACPALAGDPGAGTKPPVLKMQTAFNPNLPGAGEGVRMFTRTFKQMAGTDYGIKILEPGRVVPTPDMIDAIVAGDLQAGFTWSGYAAAKAPVFRVFATLPFGPAPDELVSWVLEGGGGPIHRAAYDKLGVVGIPCGVQGPEGGGWFRGDINTVADLKGMRLRYGDLPGEVVARLGATLVSISAGEFFHHLQQGKVDGGEMSTPAIDAALGFDKLGLPYYMPGWHQPSALLDFLMRKDKWEALPAGQRAQIESACRATIAWMLVRSPTLQAEALQKLKAGGTVIKPWSPALLDAFRRESRACLKELAERDPDFAAAWASQREHVEQGLAARTSSKLPR